MKTTLPICCLLLAACALPAQIADRVLNFGFFATPQSIAPLGEGKWLAAGKGAPFKGGRDTLFALIFDQQGQVLLQKTLAISQGESYNVTDLLPLPDGTFVVAFTAGGCDSGADMGFLQKYTPEGELLWTLQGANSDGSRPPSFWKIAPDGNLLGVDYWGVWKVDITNRAVLWKTPVAGGYFPNFFDLVPATESLLSLNGQRFERWEKTNDFSEPIYFVKNSLAIDGYWDGLGFARNGWYYAVNRNTGESTRTNADLENEMLNASINLKGLAQMASTIDGLYWLGRWDGRNWLYKTDFLGQDPVELPMPDWWSEGYALAVRGDSLAVVGTEGSGPKSKPGEGEDFPEFQALQIWFRAFNLREPVPAIITNAAITDVRQRSAVDTASQMDIYGFQHFNLQGGNFQVKISNYSPTVLEQVYVNFSYEENRSHCWYTPSVQRLYRDLHLAPGESVWVDFGDLKIQSQSGLADAFCFWTFAPDGQPDAHHEDDFYCAPAIYSAAPDSIKDIKIIPNPAGTSFRVTNLTYAQDVPWQLFSATGQLIEQGVHPAGQRQVAVSIHTLPNGFYFFKIKDYVGKIVVKH